jgi:hypothetical protein
MFDEVLRGHGQVDHLEGTLGSCLGTAKLDTGPTAITALKAAEGFAVSATNPTLDR